jgi:hypothetical protein
LAISLAYLLKKYRKFLLVRRRLDVKKRGGKGGLTLAQQCCLTDNLYKDDVWLYRSHIYYKKSKVFYLLEKGLM